MSCKLTININRRARKDQPKEKLFSLVEDLELENSGKDDALDFAIRRVQNHYGRYIKPFEWWPVTTNDNKYQRYRWNPSGQKTYATILIEVL